MPTGPSALKSERRKAINATGLEPSVGFLHEFADYQTKQSLVYDLQEPFWWIADVTVVEAVEPGILDLPDFYFTGADYRYRFETDAKRRFLDRLRERFNTGVRYKGRNLKWDTVIEQKATELGRYLAGKSSTLDFSEPSPEFVRSDDRAMRRRILNLSEAEAQRLGITRSTFYHLRRNARGERFFRMHPKVRSKFEHKLASNIDDQRYAKARRRMEVS